MALELLKSAAIPQAVRGYPSLLRSRLYAIVGLALLLIVVIILTTAVGSTDIPLATLRDAFLSKIPFLNIQQAWANSVETIIFQIRLPRLILAGLVGAALAVAGTAYQGLFRNPLADPYLIGVAQGAALGAVIGFLLPATWQTASIPLLAFLGAVLAVAFVYFIARVGKTLPMTTLILAGVALGAFLSAISYYLMIASADKLHGIISWLLGTFSMASWWQVAMVTPYIFIGIAIIWLHARALNVMQLDEDQAQQLGINVEQVKLILLAAATLITAAAVCFCGIIGFVGIIIPHAVRLVWGPDHRFLLPLATLSGATFLILADAAARTLLAPTEIPIGIITAFLGAPFFLYLLRQKKRAIF
ncbi:MAG: iron ABC transporter permease [Chloroflexi bacterium]|nr:iron ABC transporter permease [Chloroflexota bacterium]